jgi:hypothetical protein
MPFLFSGGAVVGSIAPLDLSGVLIQAHQPIRNSGHDYQEQAEVVQQQPHAG